MDAEPIAAVATPPGRGALATIRVSGVGVGAVLTQLTGHARLVPREATLVSLLLDTDFQDHALATWFPAPRSYTGEDSFELSVHGTPVVTGAVLNLLARHGVRAARPGEFTLRAFLHGKLDLVEAEAVADVIRAVTPAQARVAAAQLRGTVSGEVLQLANQIVALLERLEASLDFPDEGYHFVTSDEVIVELERLLARCARLERSGARGRLLRDGATVVVAGRPNVGKSSVFNALLGHARAIVTDVAGTTRDVLHETLELGGVPATLVDTAGVRETDDVIEREGVNRATASAEDADLVMVVIDGQDTRERSIVADAAIWQRHDGRPRCLVVNKIDGMAGADWTAPWARGTRPLLVSALTGEGVDQLRDVLAERLGQSSWEPATVTNGRHLRLLTEARESLARAADAARTGATEEFVAADVREALQALEEIRGRVAPQELLDGIFSRFCIGK